jgi:hypothetical protein
LVLHCRDARIEIRPEPEETLERAAAALPGLNRVQARLVQAEALRVLERVDQLGAALGGAELALAEAGHKLGQQNSRSSRCASNFQPRIS